MSYVYNIFHDFREEFSFDTLKGMFCIPHGKGRGGVPLKILFTWKKLEKTDNKPFWAFLSFGKSKDYFLVEKGPANIISDLYKAARETRYFGNNVTQKFHLEYKMRMFSVTNGQLLESVAKTLFTIDTKRVTKLIQNKNLNKRKETGMLIEISSSYINFKTLLNQEETKRFECFCKAFLQLSHYTTDTYLKKKRDRQTRRYRAWDGRRARRSSRNNVSAKV